jgi:hypothetical protein
MPASSVPKRFPRALRLLLAAAAIGLMFATLSVMNSLSGPSQYLRAMHSVSLKPGQTADLKQMTILDFNRHLYLVGPIVPAGGPAQASLFSPGNHPVLAPAVYTDASGAVEVLAKNLPLCAEDPQSYHFGEALHLLGWRTGESTYTLFAVARTQPALLELITRQVPDWQRRFFVQGLVLIGMIFLIFWALNLAILSNISLRPVQLLIVNLIFLVLYYSVLFLSEYPLLSSLPQTLGILALANLVFLPLAFVFRPHATGPGSAADTSQKGPR